MFQGLKALASSIPAALAGRVTVFINDTGRLATKDEAGVVTVYGTGNGGGSGAGSIPLRLTSGTVYTVPDYSQILSAKVIKFDSGAIMKFGIESILVQVN